MEGDGGDVERLIEHVIVEVVVGAVLAHVGAHADRVEHEVHGAAEHFDRFFEYLFEVLHAGCVGGDNRCVELFCEFVERSHTERHGRIAERNRCAFFNGLDSHFPCNGFFVERAEDNAALAFQKIVCHVS